MSTPRHLLPSLLGGAVLAAACLTGGWLLARPPAPWARPEVAATPAPQPGAQPARYPTAIKSGPSTPVVVTNALNHGGEPVPVACATCHATRAPNTALTNAEDLKTFHQGLAYRHGSLSCLSCHNAANYDTLRKADGTSVDYPRVMQLCAQCHGPQYRDYLAGAHGGMIGAWDQARGPRERNNCVSCHDPHAPAFPRVMPVFEPIDRAARQQRDRAAAPHGGEPHG